MTTLGTNENRMNFEKFVAEVTAVVPVTQHHAIYRVACEWDMLDNWTNYVAELANNDNNISSSITFVNGKWMVETNKFKRGTVKGMGESLQDAIQDYHNKAIRYVMKDFRKLGDEEI